MNKIFKWTLIYNLSQFIYWAWYHMFKNDAVEESLHGQSFYSILKSYLRMNPKTDFLGRVYGVINPSLNSDGKFDWSDMIFEIDGENTNNYAYVENWLYKQMLAVSTMFNLDKSGFFDNITMDIKHVGPHNADNYLVVFDTVARRQMASYFKKSVLRIFIYLLIVLGIWAFI